MIWSGAELKINKHVRKTLVHLSYHCLDRYLPRTGLGRGRGFKLPPRSGARPDTNDISMLFFAAADADYFERYGRAFIGSLFHNAPRAGIHIHLFNPRPIQIDQLAALVGNPALHLTFSWETIDLDGLDPERRGRYYYSVRFVRLAEIMADLEVPCFCLDIDALLVGAHDRLEACTRDAELAFYARFDKIGAGTKLLAGTLYLRPTMNAKCFVRAVGEQIKRYVEQGFLLEKLDQLVIYDFFKRFRGRDGGLSFQPLTENEIDLQFTARGLVWYPKGCSKGDERYRDRSREFENVFTRHVERGSAIKSCI